MTLKCIYNQEFISNPNNNQSMANPNSNLTPEYIFPYFFFFFLHGYEVLPR